jgi:hypothetical protein
MQAQKQVTDLAWHDAESFAQPRLRTPGMSASCDDWGLAQKDLRTTRRRATG